MISRFLYVVLQGAKLKSALYSRNINKVVTPDVINAISTSVRCSKTYAWVPDPYSKTITDDVNKSGHVDVKIEDKPFSPNDKDTWKDEEEEEEDNQTPIEMPDIYNPDFGFPLIPQKRPSFETIYHLITANRPKPNQMLLEPPKKISETITKKIADIDADKASVIIDDDDIPFFPKDIDAWKDEVEGDYTPVEQPDVYNPVFDYPLIPTKRRGFETIYDFLGYKIIKTKKMLDAPKKGTGEPFYDENGEDVTVDKGYERVNDDDIPFFPKGIEAWKGEIEGNKDADIPSSYNPDIEYPLFPTKRSGIYTIFEFKGIKIMSPQKMLLSNGFFVPRAFKTL